MVRPQAARRPPAPPWRPRPSRLRRRQETCGDAKAHCRPPVRFRSETLPSCSIPPCAYRIGRHCSPIRAAGNWGNAFFGADVGNSRNVDWDGSKTLRLRRSGASDGLSEAKTIMAWGDPRGRPVPEDVMDALNNGRPQIRATTRALRQRAALEVRRLRLALPTDLTYVNICL